MAQEAHEVEGLAGLATVVDDHEGRLFQRARGQAFESPGKIARAIVGGDDEANFAVRAKVYVPGLDDLFDSIFVNRRQLTHGLSHSRPALVARPSSSPSCSN